MLQGPIPMSATIEQFASLGLDLIPRWIVVCCCASAFDAWMLLLKDYGTMSLSEVLAPAINTRNGHPVVPKITETIEL